VKEQASRSDELTDEEMHRILQRPDVQAGLTEALEWLRNPDKRSRGLTAEELKESLREHG